jgi:predicted esterase
VLTRRGLLLGAAGIAGLGAAGAVGAVSLDALDDDGPGRVVPSAGDPVEPGPVVQGRFTSAARGGVPTAWALARPPGVEGALPLVVALHGHGGSAAALLDEEWDLPGALARAVVDDGVPPFALAVVSGGTSFWHERPSGEDAGAMVVDELLPLLLARPDVAVERIGLLGWSMGGYGVLRLAASLGPDRVAAVVASSPGLYLDPEGAHPDGFADAAEYERFSVMDAQDDLAGIPLRVDVGTSDPFHDATRAYVDGFDAGADVVAVYGEGGHTLEFTQRVLPAQLAFLGEHLVRG